MRRVPHSDLESGPCQRLTHSVCAWGLRLSSSAVLTVPGLASNPSLIFWPAPTPPVLVIARVGGSGARPAHSPPPPAPYALALSLGRPRSPRPVSCIATLCWLRHPGTPGCVHERVGVIERACGVYIYNRATPGALCGGWLSQAQGAWRAPPKPSLYEWAVSEFTSKLRYTPSGLHDSTGVDRPARPP